MCPKYYSLEEHLTQKYFALLLPVCFIEYYLFHILVIPTYLLSQLDACQHVCWNIMQDSPYQT
jgi:hypothetical protein